MPMVRDGCGFLKRETGAQDAQEMRVASPFDHREQQILIVPRMKTQPNDPAFADEMSVSINRIIKQLGGRTHQVQRRYDGRMNRGEHYPFTMRWRRPRSASAAS